MKKILSKLVFALLYIAFVCIIALSFFAVTLGEGDKGLIDLF